MFNFKSALAFLSSCSGLLLFIAGCGNFVLAYRACSVASVVQTNVVEVVSIVSNVVDGVSSVSNSVSPSISPLASPPSTAPVREPRQVAEYPYQYFLVGRRIGAHMFGRYYYDGSLCSYGRIDKIFPDRILLVGGDWIQNRFEGSSLVMNSGGNKKND